MYIHRPKKSRDNFVQSKSFVQNTKTIVDENGLPQTIVENIPLEQVDIRPNFKCGDFSLENMMAANAIDALKEVQPIKPSALSESDNIQEGIEYLENVINKTK